MLDKKEHWENIYSTKKIEETSWYQEKPITAIQYLNELNIPKEAAIIDVGGGDGFFVDYLLENNYEDITVLDISAKAIERAKTRICEPAKKVNWIVADACTFKSEKKYDFWYDRAAFHFLTEADDVKNYTEHQKNNLSENAQVVIGTFSENGPTKCSGIDIKQYSARALELAFSEHLTCISCQNVNHNTPFNTIQNFNFCSFVKK